MVLEALLHHLAKHAMNALISTAIIQVLGRLVPMAAGSIAGPYLLDFLRTLVSHLKTTVSRAQSSSEVGWWKRREGREGVQWGRGVSCGGEERGVFRGGLVRDGGSCESECSVL